MKPPDLVRQELVGQWLAKTDDDLAAARDMLADAKPYRWIICYHAQQAAEKYLTAFLVHRCVEPPRLHDLTDLLKAVASLEPALASELRQARVLSIYATETRYPGGLPEPTAEECREAVEVAAATRTGVRKVLGLTS